MFAVSHPSHWHAINMQQHPQHYSGLMRLMGSNVVAWLQEKGLGAEVWFNVEVDVNGKVRSTRTLISSFRQLISGGNGRRLSNMVVFQ